MLHGISQIYRYTMNDLGIKVVEQIILNDAKTYYRKLKHANNNAILVQENFLKVRRLNKDKV